MIKPILTLEDYKEAAKELDCEVEAIQAVAEVESARAGFNEDGTPVIQFEGHVFYKELKEKGIDADQVAKDHPDICYPKFTLKHVKNQKEEYSQFLRAQTIEKLAAIKSTSFGKFQIMGFNYKSAGFNALIDFVFAMQKSEREHLKAFVNFIKNEKLDVYIRDHEWTRFASAYNGPGYWKHNPPYDKRIHDAYWRYKLKNKHS